MSIVDLTNNAGWLFLMFLVLAGIALIGAGVWFASVFLLTRGKSMIREEKAMKLKFDAQYRAALESLNQSALPIRTRDREMDYR